MKTAAIQNMFSVKKIVKNIRFQLKVNTLKKLLLVIDTVHIFSFCAVLSFDFVTISI